MNSNAQDKLLRLQQIIKEMGSILVAFSGGVDSSFLLKVAHDCLGDRVLAVTAASELSATGEVEQAREIAGLIGVNHCVVATEELADPIFAANPPDRCYHCKQSLFAKLFPLAREYNLAHVVYGANADDGHDYRPGMQAAKEWGVRAPLAEAGLTKADIRMLAKALGLPNWDRPALACLASRFPYGTRITRENLAMVDKAEAFLRQLGFSQLRVRHHGDIARIEVPREDFVKITGELPGQLVSCFKSLGYRYVTLDLEGYRTGSMNEVLTKTGSK